MTDNPPTACPAGDDKVYAQAFAVPFDYPVHFTRDVFAPDHELLAEVLDRKAENRRHRAAVYVDGGAVEGHPDLLAQIKEYFHSRPEQLELVCPPQVIAGGESAKNGWATVRDVMWTIGNTHLDRQSYIICVGGGAVLDMVGFATSLVHRGLRLVRVPSTVLAQNDAGVGVKNGMDEHGQKNFVGTFAPPFAVLNDLALLSSLADRDWIGGVAEAFKVSMIKDAAFFDFLCDRAADLRGRDAAAMEHLIRRCAVLHLEHIRTNGDPFEMGSARPLDFGHWSGHKIETLSGYATGHGQAVSVGVAIDTCYAADEGLLTLAERDRVLAGLQACGLPLWHDCLDAREPDGTRTVLTGLRDFREHLGGLLTITLPHGLGRKVEVHHMNEAKVDAAIEFLRERAGAR